MKLTIALPCLLAVSLCAATIAQDKPARPKGDPHAKGKDKDKDTSGEQSIDAPDVADIPTQDLRIDKDEYRRYLLAGPRPNEKEPKDGFSLLVVLPGGDGSAVFHPFVKRLYKNAVPDGFLVVQPVAPKWTKDPPILWPTEKSKADGMKFTTEEFVESVIEEVQKAKKINASQVFTLSWSSSGPGAYVLSTRKKGLVHGSFIAMSVFHPNEIDLERVKDQPYFILHSPDDKTCPIKLAELARDTLRKNGALVEFATYPGEHGWGGDVFGNIRKGVEWLQKPVDNAQKPGKSDKSGKSEKPDKSGKSEKSGMSEEPEKH